MYSYARYSYEIYVRGNDWLHFGVGDTCSRVYSAGRGGLLYVCTCRYLSVAKNKRLRVFIVPREHLDEVGGHHSVEKIVGYNVFVNG